MVLSTMATVVFAEDAADSDSVAYVSDLDELLEALDGEATTIIMENDIKGKATQSNAYGTTGINILNGETLDGNGFTLTITGADGTWDTAINTTGGIIKNLKIGSGFRGIFVNHNSTYSDLVVLENVTIEGPVYTISCDQGTNKGLRAINCTFNGWTSYAATIGTVEFINCNFGEGAGYSFCRPYASTNFDGCDFDGGYAMDPREEVDLKGCTYDDELITSENIADLVTSRAENAQADDDAIAGKVAYIPGKGGYATLQAAIDAVVAGDNMIKLLADCDEDVIIHQQEDINITIKGNGVNTKYTGSMEIYGHARYQGAETVTIDGIYFDGSAKTEAHDFIHQNTTDSIKRYAHNVTIKNCHFEGSDNADVVATRFRQCYDIKVENCTFTNMHSAMWATGCSDGVTFDNIETVNCKNGISVGTSANVTVKNSTIEAVSEGGYGVRADGEGDYSLNVENCEIDAFAPVLVRKVNKDASVGYSLTVTNSILEASNPSGYEIVVTGADYDAPDVRRRIRMDPPQKTAYGQEIRSPKSAKAKAIIATKTANPDM